MSHLTKKRKFDITQTTKQNFYLMSIVFNCQSYKLVVIRLYIESRYRLEYEVYNCMDLDRQICSDYHLYLLSTLAHNLKIYNAEC